MQYFDYQAVAKQAGLSAEQLAGLEQEAKLDYAEDKMLYDLRLLRACNAIKSGICSLDQAVQSFRVERQAA